MAKITKVSVYDPGIDAYREVTLEVAKKFIASAEQIKVVVAKVEAENAQG